MGRQEKQAPAAKNTAEEVFIALTEDIKKKVKEHYARAALEADQGGIAGCCGGTAGEPCGGAESLFGIHLYDPAQAELLPSTAASASLGCGNPVALAGLKPAETVLDLGSGGGIDCLLAAERVGKEGFVYGLDMTDEMLALAEKNLAQTPHANLRFLKGELGKIPLPAGSVDVIISNCVVNLAPDKAEVFREVFRVLRPGGRLRIADVVLRRPLPPEIRNNAAAWSG